MTEVERASGPSLGVRILALLAGLALVAGAIVLGSSTPAAAEGLAAFSSCDDLRSHLEDALSEPVVRFEETGEAIGGGDDMATADQAEAAGPTASRAAGEATTGRDGTNTQVEGVDELDVVEVLGDGRILVARPGQVLLLSADGRRAVGSVATGPDPQITFDDGTGTLWAVSTDGMSTVLLRAVLEGDSFGDVATWQVGGRFVDLRRRGGEVHLVVVDEDLSMPEPMPLPEPIPEPLPEPSTTSTTEAPTTTTTEPETTSTTAVDPDATTTTTAPDTATTVGPDAASVEGAAIAATAFGPAQDLDTEGDAGIPFGGTSPVPCDEVLHSPLPGGVATTLVATFAAEGELAPVAATEIVGAGDNVLVTDHALYVSTPSFDGDRSVTGLHRFELDGLRHTGSGSVAGRLLNQFALDEHDGHLRAAVTTGEGFGRPLPVEGPAVDVVGPAAPVQDGDVAEALNEIVVLDLDGALDVVGRTPRFGKPGETLHGIRFAGDVAYAVTFLQTDPFYVVDLSQPSGPKVLGELEIPGFSAYLHPVGPGRVVGFGPDGEGKVAARLFDVSDPAHPSVLDTVPFADDSAVVYDHHALRVVGDQLVVAATAWVAEPLPRCAAVAPDDAARAALERQLEDRFVEMDELYRELEQGAAGTPEQRASVEARIGDLDAQIQELSECAYPGSTPRAVVATISPTATSLDTTTLLTEAGDAWRVLPLDGGYLLVGTDVTLVGGDGSIRASVA